MTIREYRTENGFWVEAKDLQEGDVFIGANGELSTLVSKERVEFDENILVYNFTVEGNHDYFVLAKEDEFGQTSILVHNAQCGDEELDKNIDDLTKNRLRGLANGGKKATAALNFLNSLGRRGCCRQSKLSY